jgi:hypothetical protein
MELSICVRSQGSDMNLHSIRLTCHLLVKTENSKRRLLLSGHEPALILSSMDTIVSYGSISTLQFKSLKYI